MSDSTISNVASKFDEIINASNAIRNRIGKTTPINTYKNDIISYYDKIADVYAILDELLIGCDEEVDNGDTE